MRPMRQVRQAFGMERLRSPRSFAAGKASRRTRRQSGHDEQFRLRWDFNCNEYGSAMQGVEECDGQVVGPETTFFIMAIEKDYRGIAAMTPVSRMDHSGRRIRHAAFVERHLGRIPDVPFGKTHRAERRSGKGIDFGHVQHQGRTPWSLSQLGGFNGAGVLPGAFVSLPIDRVNCVIEHEILHTGFLGKGGALVDRHPFVNVVNIAFVQFAVLRDLWPAHVSGEFIGEKHVSAEGVAGNPILKIQGVHISRLSEVAQVILALESFGCGPGPGHRRQQQTGQDRNDGDDHQQFDESESARPRRRATGIPHATN